MVRERMEVHVWPGQALLISLRSQCLHIQTPVTFFTTCQLASDNLTKCFTSHLPEGNGNPLQYSCLENPMDEGAWWAAVHGVARSWTQLRDFTFSFHFHALEKEIATHSSVLAWRIPGTGEPGGLPSTASHRVRHDWSDLAVAVLESI